MINKIKKLPLPVIVGLILAGVDLAFWIWFVSYGFLIYRPGIFHEGLLGMMILHMPASVLLPILGSFLLPPFLTSDSIIPIPQTIFLFVVGITQYYFVGYFIGWLIVKLRRKLGFDKSVPEPQKKPALSRKKDWIYNILHLLFTVLILRMLIDILSGMMLDFEMYKMNYPPTRHYLELALAIIWLYCTYRIVRYNKKKFDNSETFKNINKTLLFANILIVIIFSAVHIPKLSISDIPEATGLDSVYARQQAGIFFDNPLERLIVMKTAIVGMDEKMYQVVAYTFFGLKYRLTDIEKVSEYEMRLLLNPAMQKKQYEAQIGVAEILKRIEHSEWPRVTYSELIKNTNLGPEKIQAIVSDIEEVNSLFLKTDYAEHEVYLLAYLEDVYTNSMKKDFVFEDMMPQSDYVISTKEVKISKAHTDSVLDSYRIEFKDRPYYIIFDIVSDQEPPADLNHIWDPDHNVKDEDILQILKSLTTSQTVTEELASKFKSTMPDVDIKFQKESFLWWNDEDGYSILVPGIESIEISKDDGARVDNFTKSSFVRGLLEIVDQVMEDRDFSLNEKNTSIDETDKKFYDYVRAFENSEELCVVRVNPDYSSHGCADNMFMCNEVEITCGNDLVGSQTEQRPFLEALDLQNKEKIIRTRKQIGDYFQLGVSGRRAGSEAVMKKEDSGLRLIYMSQEDPLCELLDKEKIPSNVLSSFKIEGCWTETGYRNIDE